MRGLRKSAIPPRPEGRGIPRCSGEKDQQLEDASRDTQATLDDEQARFEEALAKAQEDAESKAKQDALSAISELAQELLTSIDSLEKALDTMTGPQDKAHREGIQMILDMQRQALAKHGIEIIPALGEPFNPHVHEAVAMDNASQLPKNTVTDVLQAGYHHHGKLLRPAMVRVQA